MAAARSVVKSETVMEGDSVLLSCRYSVKRYGLSHACWGRSCGTLWCNGILAQADGSGVISKVSDHYRFAGDVLAGEMDLHIPKVTLRDGGQYCCRVDIDGYFNDKKVSYTLRVVKAPVVTAPSVATDADVTEPAAPTEGQLGMESSLPEAKKWNSSPSASGAIEENPLPEPALRINVSVLSFSLSVLLLLLALLGLLAVKREVQKRHLGKESQAPVEPPHIIYEIQTRKPVEENIYTLD